MLRTRITFERCLILLQFSLFIQIEARENCTSNTYHDKDLGLCLPCSSCDAFSIQLKDCTGTSNTVCLKCAGPDRNKNSECKRCRPCRRGQFLTSPCTPEAVNVCQRCRKGTYSAKPSFSTRCLSCLDCKGLNRRTLRPCKAHKDAVCGTCRKGYYEVPGVHKCLPCRPCTSRRQKVKACQRWGGETSCGFILQRSRPRTRTRKYGNILRYDSQSTTDSLVMTSSKGHIDGSFHIDGTSHINRTSHIKRTSKDDKGRFDVVYLIIIILSSFTIILTVVGALAMAHRQRKKKATKPIITEEKSSIIGNKKDTEVKWSPKYGHCLSLSSSDVRVIKSYLSLAQSDPGQGFLYQNASVLHGLSSPSSKKIDPERYREPHRCSASVPNVKRTFSENRDPPIWMYYPEPLQPPPPPPLHIAFTKPPEIPPRGQYDFMTM